MSSIRPLDDDDTWIRSQTSCQLPVADVDRIHPGGTALQQAICEPSRTRAEIGGDETSHLNAKVSERMIELVATTAHKFWRRFEGQFVAASDSGSSPRDRRSIDEHVGGHDQRLSP